MTHDDHINPGPNTHDRGTDKERMNGQGGYGQGQGMENQTDYDADTGNEQNSDDTRDEQI